jgi:hypothetical protein
MDPFKTMIPVCTSIHFAMLLNWNGLMALEVLDRLPILLKIKLPLIWAVAFELVRSDRAIIPKLKIAL